MKRELFLHLGLPKTGTTVLQNRVFINNNEYTYLGKHNPKFTSDAREKDKWIIELKNDFVDKDFPHFENLRFDQIITKKLIEDKDNTDKLFLSEEGFLGRCLSPRNYNGMPR